LAWLVLPFAALVALSRVILGMHYPTDVIVGAALGVIIAYTSLTIFPMGMFAGLI
jgi:undecaprenyl-diphosphatase